MIDVEAVKQLLSQGWNQRSIARKLNIARGTVSAIAHNKYKKPRQPKPPEFWQPGPLARCKTCGGLVYMPCLLCAIRKV